MNLSFTLAPLLLAAPAGANSDWIVGPPGSGADFNLIGPAVAAAAPGDSIFVLPGQYAESAGLVIDKPLTVLGAGSAVTRLQVPIGSFGGCAPLQVLGTAPQETVQFGGIELAGVGSFAYDCGVFVADCDGPVFLHDVQNFDGVASAPRPLYLRVDRSGDVSMERCAFEGVHTSGDCGTPPGFGGAAAVRATDSGITLNGCDLWGGEPIEACFVVDGVPGLHLIRSSARVSGSVLEGSEDGGTLSGVIPGWQGIELEDSTAELFGGTQVQGGLFFQGTRGTALILEPGGELTVTDDVTFESSGGNPAIIDLGGVLNDAPERWVSALATPALGGIGSSFTLDLKGEPNAFTLTYSGSLSLSIGIPGVSGPLQLDPSSLEPFPGASLDASGNASLTLAVPNDLVLQGESIVLQSLAVSPTLGLSISPPYGFAVGY